MDQNLLNSKGTPQLPWWTWVVPPLLFHLGSEFSILFKYDQGVVTYYLPTALSVILINWWGPWRVLPAMFINAIVSTSLWGDSEFYLWPVYAIPETLFTFLSWLFFTKLGRGQFWLPDIRETLLFLLFGVVLPFIPEIFLLEGIQIIFGDRSSGTFWTYAIFNLLSEFISNFGLTLPVLYYLTPFMKRKNWLLNPPKRIDPFPFKLGLLNIVEVLLIYTSLIIFSFTVDFERYWFVYGIFSLYIAMRYGFGLTVISNLFIFGITYIIPMLLHSYRGTSQIEISNIFLGTSLLHIFAALTGRVLNDLKISRMKLNQQFHQLTRANRELDRFVYSVSHDLSAPLKSILGLVNIGRLTENTSEQLNYFEKIEGSVRKLESFIKEVLDYSKSKRLDIVVEQIKLKDLCGEILENLRYMEEYPSIEIDMQELSSQEILNDKMHLKIILNNILTNAIKYQKRAPDHRGYVKISSQVHAKGIIINVEDNGEGIHPDVRAKIFNMFFRGNQNSRGSGLGLYIAKEAAKKIQANISVRSEFGKGSVFSIALANLSA